MTPESKLKKLEALLKLVDESITRDEFVASFENVLNHVLEAERKLGSKIDQSTTQAIRSLSDAFQEFKSSSSQDFQGLRAEIESSATKMFKEQADGMNQVRDTLRRIKNGKDGKDGQDGADGSPDTGDEIVNKINSSDSLIGKKSIEGLEDLEKKVDTMPTGRVGGAKGFTLYVNGVKKLLTAQTLNITGTGVSYNFANGRNDVTITGGSGSFGILAATGTIDDANTAFTFASEPVVVVVNGATYRNGAGATISGTSVTLDNPVGTGGDIYGLG